MLMVHRADRVSLLSDQTLRELERRFRASGSLEDEAAWLRVRVKAGQLEQSRLRLAAYCGHHAASSALGASALPTWNHDSVPGFVLGLRPFGPSVWLRATWAASREYCRRLTLELGRSDGDRTRDFRLNAELRIAEAATRTIGDYLRDPNTQNLASLRDWAHIDPLQHVGFAVHHARRTTLVASPQTVVLEVCAEIVPWALGACREAASGVLAHDAQVTSAGRPQRSGSIQ